jgi:hypothetical protein
MVTLAKRPSPSKSVSPEIDSAPRQPNFFDLKVRKRFGPGLGEQLRDLVELHGIVEVDRELKPYRTRGAPKLNNLELKLAVGRSEAALLLGIGTVVADREVRRWWVNHPSGRKETPEARRKQVSRELKVRKQLGLAVAFVELWPSINLEARKKVIQACLELAAETADRDASDYISYALLRGDEVLEDRSPSRGMVRDLPGAPRYKWPIDRIVEWLIALAITGRRCRI